MSVQDFSSSPPPNDMSAAFGAPPTRDAGFASVAVGASEIGGGAGAHAGKPEGDRPMQVELGGERIDRVPWQPDQPVIPISAHVGQGPFVAGVDTAPVMDDPSAGIILGKV